MLDTSNIIKGKKAIITTKEARYCKLTISIFIIIIHTILVSIMVAAWFLRGNCTAWKVSRYRVFSGPYFPAFGLNTESYLVSLRIQSESGKMWTRKNSVFGYISHSISLPIITHSFPSLYDHRCGALRDLILFVQFKKREKHPWRSVNFSKVEDFSLHFYENYHSFMGVFHVF